MKAILLLVALAAPAFASAPPYFGQTINTAAGTASQYLSGTDCIAASSASAGTCTISLNGPTGAITAASVNGASNASGYASINAAVAALGASTTTLVISAPETLTANLVVPQNLSLQFANGGSIVESSNYSLTINGPLSAGKFPIFSGFSAGGVSFGTNSISDVNAEWFGLNLVSTTTDSTPILQTAIDSLLPARYGNVWLGTDITISSTVVLRSGISFIGAGARKYSNLKHPRITHAPTGTNVDAFVLESYSGASGYNPAWKVANFSLYGGTNSYAAFDLATPLEAKISGVDITGTFQYGVKFYGALDFTVEDTNIAPASTGVGILVTHGSMVSTTVKFKNLNMSGGQNLVIAQSNSFTDLTFTDCIFESSLSTGMDFYTNNGIVNVFGGYSEDIPHTGASLPIFQVGVDGSAPSSLQYTSLDIHGGTWAGTDANGGAAGATSSFINAGYAGKISVHGSYMTRVGEPVITSTNTQRVELHGVVGTAITNSNGGIADYTRFIGEKVDDELAGLPSTRYYANSVYLSTFPIGITSGSQGTMTLGDMFGNTNTLSLQFSSAPANAGVFVTGGPANSAAVTFTPVLNANNGLNVTGNSTVTGAGPVALSVNGGLGATLAVGGSILGQAVAIEEDQARLNIFNQSGALVGVVGTEYGYFYGAKGSTQNMVVASSASTVFYAGGGVVPSLIVSTSNVNVGYGATMSSFTAAGNLTIPNGITATTATFTSATITSASIATLTSSTTVNNAFQAQSIYASTGNIVGASGASIAGNVTVGGTFAVGVSTIYASGGKVGFFTSSPGAGVDVATNTMRVGGNPNGGGVYEIGQNINNRITVTNTSTGTFQLDGGSGGGIFVVEDQSAAHSAVCAHVGGTIVILASYGSWTTTAISGYYSLSFNFGTGVLSVWNDTGSTATLNVITLESAF